MNLTTEYKGHVNHQNFKYPISQTLGHTQRSPNKILKKYPETHNDALSTSIKVMKCFEESSFL